MRRVTEHQKHTLDGEELSILTCYEEGIKKEQIKKENPFSKKHEILKFDGQRYEFLPKQA
ncbi:hypothetical protein QNH20_18425 [Neobacillus sp. WH10]|uniref:hypothetical protein n=1 Tax=Neobacillus sp. WH10 TaxID=3047873 RepID=UPI0024C1B7EA|nr:hypothetical protein [Neobacillus sp. WH10]WHY76089.1 hypothetical protein QNH20_18425 [Neobacillus sp. WH10]